MFRDHVLEPLFRGRGSTDRCEGARREFAADRADDYDDFGGPSAMQRSVEQLLVAMPAVKTLSQMVVKRLEALECAPSQLPFPLSVACS